MRTVGEFKKMTLIGGILIALPIYVSLLLLAKTVQALLAAVKPITAGIPGFTEFREILAILAPVPGDFVRAMQAAKRSQASSSAARPPIDYFTAARRQFRENLL
jgi:hypothetical protein